MKFSIFLIAKLEICNLGKFSVKLTHRAGSTTDEAWDSPRATESLAWVCRGVAKLLAESKNASMSRNLFMLMTN